MPTTTKKVYVARPKTRATRSDRHWDRNRNPLERAATRTESAADREWERNRKPLERKKPSRSSRADREWDRNRKPRAKRAS